jgi:hypothetical protein
VIGGERAAILVDGVPGDGLALAVAGEDTGELGAGDIEAARDDCDGGAAWIATGSERRVGRMDRQ